MSFSYKFQVTTFISAMAKSIVVQTTEIAEQSGIEDFSPDAPELVQCRIQNETSTTDFIAPAWLRPWLPSVETLVAELQMTSPANSAVRDFATVIAPLEVLTASNLNLAEQLSERFALSERSLTIADFRHAVDQQIDQTMSIWQNN